MGATYYLAVDLGAESGRVMLGTLEGGRLALEEIHRFPNHSIMQEGGLFWDLAHLKTEVIRGVELGTERNVPIAGISTDSWAVDYVFLDAAGQVLAPPHSYRDVRTVESMARLYGKVSPAEIYAETGIQLMALNTLFQFEAEMRDPASPWPRAASFLCLADYFNALFSGVAVLDQSMASTTQLYDPRTETWSPRLIETLGLPAKIFPKIVPCGTVLGPVTGPLAARPALAGTKIVASASHDTGTAVAAVPAEGEDWAYLSSGTWSLLGAELAEPIMTDAALAAGFTNEIGLEGSVRFLKNIAGLWVIQECRRTWEAQGHRLNYDEITRLATAAGPARAKIDIRDPRFLTSGDMPDKIAALCRETGQPVPQTPGEYVRLVLEALATCYRETLAVLENLTGRHYEKIHIVGGGCRNDLLNQLTADATGRVIVTGPVEATAIGNVLIQALALGHIGSFAHLRRMVGDSFPTRTFTPAQGAPASLSAAVC